MSTRPDLEISGAVEIANRRRPRLRVAWDLRELTHYQKPRLWSLPARLGPATVHPTRWGVGARVSCDRLPIVSEWGADFYSLTVNVDHGRTNLGRGNINIWCAPGLASLKHTHIRSMHLWSTCIAALYCALLSTGPAAGLQPWYRTCIPRFE